MLINLKYSVNQPIDTWEISLFMNEDRAPFILISGWIVLSSSKIKAIV